MTPVTAKTPSPPALPPTQSAATGQVHVFKRYKYVTLEFRPREGDRATFTVHQVEARKFLKILASACDSPPEWSDEIHRFSFVEGVHTGGPPLLSQIVDSPPAQATDAPPVDPLWELWRQDDNGNRFLVSAGHSRAEADRLAADFEARGHKQMYWVSPAVG
jgi:hypothetical protein